MTEHKVSIQSLIDHIKTAVDVDPWAKEMAEELLKAQEVDEPKQVDLYGKDEWWGFVCVCPYCKAEWMSATDDTHFCPNCGRKVKWDDNRT